VAAVLAQTALAEVEELFAGEECPNDDGPFLQRGGAHAARIPRWTIR
jgi:hypothetical protein